MIVKKEKLRAYLDEHQLTIAQFAAKLKVKKSEVENMLSGQAVGYDTAKKFIYFMKADKAQDFIDWKAINKKNPLSADDYLEEVCKKK